MKTIDLVTLSETYAAHVGLALSTVSTYAANDGKYFGNLKAGAGCTLAKAARLFGWFDQNWPADLQWPADIDRPSAATLNPKRKRKAA
jgi:hypothetical protein